MCGRVKYRNINNKFGLTTSKGIEFFIKYKTMLVPNINAIQIMLADLKKRMALPDNSCCKLTCSGVLFSGIVICYHAAFLYKEVLCEEQTSGAKNHALFCSVPERSMRRHTSWKIILLAKNAYCPWHLTVPVVITNYRCPPSLACRVRDRTGRICSGNDLYIVA